MVKLSILVKQIAEIIVTVYFTSKETVVIKLICRTPFIA